MPPIDPEREAVGRSIAAFLMASQIRQAGQIHSETVLADIGALAGFAAQVSIRKGVIEPQGLDPNAVLAEIVTKNDEKYYFSEYFWQKMVVLVIAFVYMFTIRRSFVRADEGRRAPIWRKAVGLGSIALWLFVAVWGRFIGLLS